VEEAIPGFFEKQNRRVARILARGKVRTEDEWYLIRETIDRIEADASRRGAGASLQTGGLL
jgi:hypothetical protein